MSFRTRLTCATLTALIALSITNPAAAAFVLTVSQSGSNVIGTGSGSIDVSGLADYGATGAGGLVWASYPGTGGSALGLGPAGANAEAYLGAISGPVSFGSGPEYNASSGSGDSVAIASLVGAGQGAVFVPTGYVSGAALADTATWQGTTIAGLGLLPGAYTYIWGHGAAEDSFTVNVLAANVPEPSAASLMVLGAVLFALSRVCAAARGRIARVAL